MTTGEGTNPRDGREPRDDRDRRGDRIAVASQDDAVARIQLAARWAESYTPEGDSLGGMLKRFRAAFEYLDAVIHGVEPAELTREVTDVRPSQPAAETAPTPAYANPAPHEGHPQTAPPSEGRAWG